MNLESIKTLATSKVARQALLARKYSPKILFIAGTVGVVGAVVLACRATLKMDDVLQNAEEEMSKAKALHVDMLGDDAAYIDETDQAVLKKELRKIQVKAALKITKLYAPAVVLGGASIAALTGSHVILTKRNSAVMAAYAGLDRAYKEYRKRVSNEYGEDIDRRFGLGGEYATIEEKLADGKTKTTKNMIPGVHPDRSPYAALFDERSHKFSRQPGMNAEIVMMQQNYANDKLRARGHLFLNEVHDMLGLPRTSAGQIVGWVYRHDSEPKNGDNYVTFGVFENNDDQVEAFLDGHDKGGIWLDFNVDGPVYNLI